MTWKCILSDPDVLCYQKSKKSYAVRIEARKVEDAWKIYKSYYNNADLNITETFEAKDRNEMESLLAALRTQPDPTIKHLRERMIVDKKVVKVKLQRAYKEYNVEKWKFTVNSFSHPNFLVLRFYDATELDIVMHEQLAKFERQIVRELLKVLGVDSADDDVTIRCYYFRTQKDIEFANRNEKPHIQIHGWFSE